MPLYHLTIKIFSRSDGIPIFDRVAYRARANLCCSLGLRYDYSWKKDLVHGQIFLPRGAPARLADRTALWQEIDRCETRKDSQWAREIEVSLPRELSSVRRLQVVSDWIVGQFISDGMAADLAIHQPLASDKSDQPHAHILLTLRRVGPGGFGQKERRWNSRKWLKAVRESWSVAVNKAFGEDGFDLRVDHRSHEKLFHGVIPEPKIGPARRMRASELARRHSLVQAENRETFRKWPALAVSELIRSRSTFTQVEIVSWAAARGFAGNDRKEIVERITASPRAVCIGRTQSGRILYTSKTLLRAETLMLAYSDRMVRNAPHFVDFIPDSSTELLQDALAAAHYLMGPESLRLIVGQPGIGITKILGATAHAYATLSYSVIRVALERPSASKVNLIAFLADLGAGRAALSERHLLILDSAHRVSVINGCQLLRACHRSGAKLIMAGDDTSEQAIDGAAAFHTLVDHLGCARLKTIDHRITFEHKLAANLFEVGDADQAINLHQVFGSFYEMDKIHHAMDAAATHYLSRCAEGASILVTARRTDADLLTRIVRQKLIHTGTLSGPGVKILATERCEEGPGDVPSFKVQELEILAGERVLFNRTATYLGVVSGDFGSILTVTPKPDGNAVLSIDLDNGRNIKFSVPHVYDEMSYGYAVVTGPDVAAIVDHAVGYLAPNMNAGLAYQMLTRHRKTTRIFYDRQTFPDFAAVKKMLTDWKGGFCPSKHPRPHGFVRRSLTWIAQKLARKRWRADLEAAAAAPAPRDSAFALRPVETGPRDAIGNFVRSPDKVAVLQHVIARIPVEVIIPGQVIADPEPSAAPRRGPRIEFNP